MDDMASERLQKLMANAGLCSRRQAEQLLGQGLVQVNGAVAQLGDRADPERDRITVRGEPLAARPQPLLLLLNKPAGVICSCHDPEGRTTVLDLQRLAIGPLQLGELPEGRWRRLDRQEWQLLNPAPPP